ncbi:M1 family aminopeptidase [Labedaea rhizosphaerae]|uniref:Transcription initiation factor TFIID subunit 2 n=1 Tax=Labedaea rhizosphaerae TaxID=598644 RepID=A0A4R6SNB8_LABRH|nr:M1 family aminopeptidase [Labedaea rhizosphaerae]TDQ05504.1 peptidase M1-like protein [Labedaea rhizosphaerae]
MAFAVRRYHLELDYAPATDRLTGRATLHGVGEIGGFELALAWSRVSKVLVDRRPARFTHRDGKLRVRAAASGSFTVEVHYAGSPGQRPWFPHHEDSSEKAGYGFAISVPPGCTVVANGLLEDHVPGPKTSRWYYEQAEPTSSRFVTVQVGQFEFVEPARDQKVACPADLVAEVRATFGEQPRMMRVFEDLFGRYPFEGYTVVVTDQDRPTPIAAQTVSVFGRNHLGARELAAQDLLARQLAHQWFGASVTPEGEQDSWLADGFAAYAVWLWAEKSGAEPTAERPAERGAQILHALREYLGDAAFFALLREWVATHEHGIASTGDFVTAARRHGVDDRLAKWLRHPGIPENDLA